MVLYPSPDRNGYPEAGSWKAEGLERGDVEVRGV